MKTLDLATSIGLILFGCFMIYSGFTLGLSFKGVFGPGFLPLWIGIFLIILSSLQLLETLKKRDNEKPNPFIKKEFKNFFIIILGSIGAFLITPFTGLLLALGIMAAFIAKLMGTKKTFTIIVVLIITPLVLYVIFDLGLGVPLPRGILRF